MPEIDVGVWFVLRYSFSSIKDRSGYSVYTEMLLFTKDIGLSISLFEILLSTKDAWVLFVCFVLFFLLVGIEILHLP